MADDPVALADRPVASRYEARVGGALAGFLDYRLMGTRRILLHTEVLRGFEGRGIGGALARLALDDARAAGRRVTVKCPFVLDWLLRHPGYDDIVTPAPDPRSGR